MGGPAVEVPEEIRALARSAQRVTVLTGAGMSAESGVPTFRDAETGLWAHYDPMQLATPQAFARDPATVWAWYLWRFVRLRGVEPNAGHRALAEWSRRTAVRIVTQNVDDLHERAGSAVLAHLHGSLLAFRCAVCAMPYAGAVVPPPEPVASMQPPSCGSCGGPIRPGVVWFGEALPTGPYDAAVEACRESDLVLVVGTSGIVYPAAALPEVALAARVPVLEINPEPTGLTDAATHSWRTTAAVGLPALVAAVPELDPTERRAEGPDGCASTRARGIPDVHLDVSRRSPGRRHTVRG